MDWVRILAYITGTVNQELLLRLEMINVIRGQPRCRLRRLSSTIARKSSSDGPLGRGFALFFAENSLRYLRRTRGHCIISVQAEHLNAGSRNSPVRKSAH